MSVETMSDDKDRVSLNMLQTQLDAADEALIQAMERRVEISKALHEAQASQSEYGGFTPHLNLVRHRAMSDFENYARQAFWAATFPLDVKFAGIERVLVSGADPMRIWDAARSFFGHDVAMSLEADPRDIMIGCMETENAMAALGWVQQPGSGQWWPILNESKFSDLRIVGSWPMYSEEMPVVAILARADVSTANTGATLLMAHDDRHAAERVLNGLDIEAMELGRARSLVLIKANAPVTRTMDVISTARDRGLDGLRIVGALPAY